MPGAAQQPFVFQGAEAQFDFGTTSDTKKKGTRKRALKTAQATDPSIHSRNAAARPRDEEGRFLRQKTDSLDLQLKLDTKEDEVEKLKEQISQRDHLVSQLQQQLDDLRASSERQHPSLSDADQLRLFHDARFIREFKARQQYLHEIEMAAQQRLAAILAKTEEAKAKSAANTPNSVSLDSTSTPAARTPFAGEPMSISTSGVVERQVPTPQSTASEEHDPLDAMILSAMSPPASWIEEPWNQEVPRPYREKIDLTKIELRPVEPPPNLVEHARMEYYEGQRQWQQQQQHVQRHMAQLGYSAMQGPLQRMHAPPRAAPLPAFAEKIDLAAKVARLRKTPSALQLPSASAATASSMDEEGMQLLQTNSILGLDLSAGPLTPMSLGLEGNDPMVTDDLHAHSVNVFNDNFLNSTNEMGDFLDESS